MSNENIILFEADPDTFLQCFVTRVRPGSITRSLHQNNYQGQSDHHHQNMPNLSQHAPVKVMAAVLWDAKVIIMVVYLPKWYATSDATTGIEESNTKRRCFSRTMHQGTYHSLPWPQSMTVALTSLSTHPSLQIWLSQTSICFQPLQRLQLA